MFLCSFDLVSFFDLPPSFLVVTESESEPEDNVASRVDRIQGAMSSSAASSSSSSLLRSSSTSALLSSSSSFASPFGQTAAVASPSSGMNSLDWLFEVGATTGGIGGNTSSKNLVSVQQPPLPIAPVQKPSQSSAQLERKQLEAKREQLKNTFFEKMKHRKAHDLVQVTLRLSSHPCLFLFTDSSCRVSKRLSLSFPIILLLKWIVSKRLCETSCRCLNKR